MSDKQTPQENEILRGVVGSTAHGLAIEGQDDRDEMGVFIEPAKNVCGLQSIDHFIRRDKPEGIRSEPGDLDLTLYSLRKFCRLATKGNPSILVLLWLPEYITKTDVGRRLIELRGAFHSQESGKRFLGYLISQKKALKKERSPKVSRPELVEKYGFDTKFAMHALRLGFEGIEYLKTGALTLPVKEPTLSILRGVRTGIYTLSETLEMIEQIEAELIQLVDQCTTRADRPRIDRFLVDEHHAHWLWS